MDHQASQEVGIEKPTAARLRKSAPKNGLVSFVGGKTCKTSMRLLTAKGPSPQSYRACYSLPVDYPMVAPSYAERGTALAKAIGLGQPATMAARSRKGGQVAETDFCRFVLRSATVGRVCPCSDASRLSLELRYEFPVATLGRFSPGRRDLRGNRCHLL